MVKVRSYFLYHLQKLEVNNMTVKIQGYNFEGPFTKVGDLEDRSGVYAILDRRNDGLYVVDVGESSEVKTRISNHDRKPCWSNSSKGKLAVAVRYTPGLQQSGRKSIEQDIRGEYHPSCGDR